MHEQKNAPRKTCGRFGRLLPLLLALSLILLCGCAAPTLEAPAPEAEETLALPVLMYHHLLAEGETGSGMPASLFRDQMRALSEAGYEPVGFDQVLAWVEDGGALPARPIVITFDDGYASNYELAYPILREYGFKATIFVIGVSVGKTTYKDTDRPIIPHFTLEQAEEMEASGLISIQSHGYNIHEQRDLDPEPLRQGILRREGETEEDYLAFLHEDCARMIALLGKTPWVLSYPKGLFDDLSDTVLREEGIRITLTTRPEMNTLRRGDPECLWRMSRFGCDDRMTAEELMELLAAAG